MQTVVGSCRNHNLFIVEPPNGSDYDYTQPIVEVVMLTLKPSYGVGPEGKITKGHEVGEIRFNADPHTLRTLAEQFRKFADEADEYQDEYGIETEEELAEFRAKSDAEVAEAKAEATAVAGADVEVVTPT